MPFSLLVGRRVRRLARAAAAALPLVVLATTLLGVGAVVRPAHAQGATRIILDVPPGYTAATRFTGFVDEARGASILINELPAAAYDQLAVGMTPEALKTQQVVNARVGRLAARRGDHIYITAEQTAAGDTYAKFILVARERDVTALITMNVPKDAIASGTVTTAECEATLVSTRVSDAPVADTMRFTLGDTGLFKSAGTLGGGASMYTLDGVLTPATPDPTRPLFMVAQSLDARPIADLAAFARRALEETRGFSGLAVTGEQSLTIAGQAAVEHLASANEARENTAVNLFQVTLGMPGGGYLRVMGQATPADWERLLPEFRRMAASLSLKP